MKTDRNQMIEMVGIFGVIASLVFVGMQLMLDRRIAIANQYQTRAELRHQTALTQFGNRDFLEVQAARWEAQRPGWWNDEVEAMYRQSNEPMLNIVRDTINYQVYSIVMDNNYYQFQQGLMDEGNWLPLRQGLKDFILGDPLRRAYISRTSSLSNLNNLVREVISEIDSES